MAIPMEIPARFLPRVLAGEVVRYGCILQDVATGRILGHPEEVGQTATLLADIPVGPLAAVGSWIDSHWQLKRIQHVLQHLEIISTVGAVASVAGLGVSVAGFALVLRRLGRLEQNLNQALDRLRADVERVHLRLDLLAMADLRAAWEQLAGARQTGPGGRAAALLTAADGTFQKYRNYYFALITELEPLRRPQLSLAQARELYGRFLACALAEVEANLRLGDLPQWHFRHGAIKGQLEAVCRVDARDVLRRRADAAGLLTGAEREQLRGQAELTRDFCRENQARLATADEEVKWLERSGSP